MNKIELRCELRADNDSRLITGKAISFETESNDLGFIEILHRGCITQDVIDSSNICFTYNHDRSKVLARRKCGSGNLDIDLRQDGLYFSFNAPKTSLGSDVLEDIRCGNLSKCSFAFTIPDEESAQKWTKIDNVYHRDIYKIDRLYDLSVVVDEAYPDTYIQARSEEFAKIKDELDKVQVQEPEPEKRDEECIDIQENPETPAPEEVVVEVQEENTENQDEEQINNTEVEENPQPEAVETQPEPQIETKNKPHITMEKRFSLLNAINAIASNQRLSDIDSEIVSRGMQEMRNAGLSFNGQIQIPVSELRANVTVSAEGEDIIATQLFDIVTPLREKNVLVQAGAKFLTGLKSDIQIPLMSPSNVAWATEVAAATDGAPTFSNITLSPNRLTAYVNISKQLLVQDTLDVENVIRQDLIKAINHKLEATILGDAAGVTGQQPAGMLYGVSPEEVSDYAGIAAVEAVVECSNVFGDNLKWVVNPKFKAALRSLSLGGNVAANLYVNNEIAGTPALSTGHLDENLAIYGDWSNLVIGQWGAVDITVDPYT